MPSHRFSLLVLGAVAASLCFVPTAAADVSVLRSFSAQNLAFALDASGGVYVARAGGVDHLTATGADAGDGFTVPANFTQPNDIERVGSRLYAVDAGANKLHAFDTNGTNQQVSAAGTDSKVNLARAVGVSGTKVYVGAGETNRIARLTTTPTFGAWELTFGWGVNDAATQAFVFCEAPQNCFNTGFSGSEPGKIGDPRAIEVDGSGNLYVSETGTGTSRIEVYSPAPAPIKIIGSHGSGAGQINRPFGIAFDGAGNLFVADSANNRIAQFRTDGTFVQAFGYGVATGASQLETCTSSCQTGVPGNGEKSGQLRLPFSVAYRNGELYVSDFPLTGSRRITVFGVAPPTGGGGGGGGTPLVPPQCSDGKDNDADGATDTQDPGCASRADTNEADETLNDLVLCGRRQISLVRADAKGGKVALSGLVSQANAGKPVEVFANYGARKKAKAGRFTRLKTVKASKTGQFTARVKRPPARLFAKARFIARVGKARSVALKLPQSLASSSVRKAGANIELRGKVTRSLLGKRNAVVIRRLVCGRYQTVGSAKPSKSGAYVVRFRAPLLGAAALYRAESKVLAKRGSKRYVRQFARAIGITLTGQTAQSAIE